MIFTTRILSRAEFEQALTLATVTSGIGKTTAIARLRASDVAMRIELDRLRLELCSKSSQTTAVE